MFTNFVCAFLGFRARKVMAKSGKNMHIYRWPNLVYLFFYVYLYYLYLLSLFVLFYHLFWWILYCLDVAACVKHQLALHLVEKQWQLFIVKIEIDRLFLRKTYTAKLRKIVWNLINLVGCWWSCNFDFFASVTSNGIRTYTLEQMWEWIFLYSCLHCG